MMTRKTSRIISHGKAARTTCRIGIPVIPEVTNRLSPTGGVIMPISMFTTMMMPRWIGSMPSFMAMGNRIGARIRMIAEGSMKLPATSRRMLTTIRAEERGVGKEGGSTCRSLWYPDHQKKTHVYSVNIHFILLLLVQQTSYYT